MFLPTITCILRNPVLGLAPQAGEAHGKARKKKRKNPIGEMGESGGPCGWGIDDHRLVSGITRKAGLEDDAQRNRHAGAVVTGGTRGPGTFRVIPETRPNSRYLDDPGPPGVNQAGAP